MPTRNFQPTSTFDNLDGLDGVDALNDGVLSVQFAGALHPALQGIRSLQSKWQATPTPQQPVDDSRPRQLTSDLPIVVSASPDLQPIQTLEQMQQTYQSGQTGQPVPALPEDTSGVEPGGPPTAYGSAASSAPAGSPAPAGAQPSSMPTGQAPAGGAFKDNDERLAFIRQTAAAEGHDPETVATVAMHEGAGPAGSVGDNGRSFGGLQAYTGPEGGQGTEFRQQTGLDPADPANERALLTWQIKNLNRTGWSPFHGAAAAGIGDRQGIGTGSVHPNAPSTSPAPAPAAMPQGQPSSQYAPGSYTPNQINAATSEGLDYETALAVCGPAAAIAFARKTGRNPTMQEALGLARQVGWTAAQGMAGPASERQLLATMGIASRLVDGTPNWESVAADVQRGNPVIVSTPGHYFVAEQYDPATGKFNFGNSAAILKAAKGQTWFTPDEMAGLGMGAPRASLFMDSPTSPAPSVVAGKSEPVAQSQGGPPWEASPLTASSTATSTSVESGTSTSGTVPATRSTDSASPSQDLMLRQPLNQPTSGPDTFSTPFASTATDGLSTSTPFSADQFPSFQDSQSAPAESAAPIGVPPVSPSPPTSSQVSSDALSETSAPWQTPSAPAQTQPSAPTDAASAAAAGPGGSYPAAGAFQDTQLEAAPSSPIPAPQTVPDESGPPRAAAEPAPTPLSQRFNPLDGEQPAPQPGELPQRPGTTPNLPEVVQAVNRGETVNPFHWANQVSDASAEEVVRQIGMDPASVSGMTAKFVISTLVNPVNWQGGAFSSTAEGIALAGRPILEQALPAIAEKFGAQTAGRLSTWLAGQGAKVGAEAVGGAVAGAVTQPEDPGMGAAAGGAMPAIGAAAPAVRRAISSGVESARGGLTHAGEALSAGAERAAARGEGQAAPAYGVFGVAPPEARPAYSPTAPPGHTRMYHGTASDFPSVNPEQLDPKSLYGRGYYLTSDPRVAGGIVDETGNVVSAGYAQQRGRIARATSEEVQGHFNDIAAQTRKTGAPGAEDLAQAYEEIASEIPAGKTFDEDQVARLSAGALWRTPNSVSPVDDVLWGPAREARGALFENKGDNVRPVDVPNNLRLINADAPMTPETANRVRQVIRQIESTRPDIAEHFQDTLSNLRDYLKRSGKTAADTPLNDWVIKDLMTDAERAGYVSDGKYGGNDLATAILEQAGFDGIAHKGGQRVPMMDGTGQPIEHDVNVIFPGSVSRVRNALAGTYGGATLGTTPAFPGAARATDRLGAVNRVLGHGVASAVSGGVGAATNQQLNPDDPNAALKGFAAGAIAPYAISRGAGALARRAGKAVPEVEGALASLGHVPEEMHPLRTSGQLPMEGMPRDPLQQGMSGVAPIPGAPRLPEAVARAQALAERQSQAAARAGRPAPPSVWDWIKAAGYAGIYSPATAVSSAVGGATELVLAQPKEAIRALVQGRPGAYGAQVRAQIGALGESLPGVWNVLTGNAAGSAAASGGSRGTAGLSERVSTPVGHFAARTLEKPGEILTEAPDAVFRPLFRAQGAAREAQQAASDIGLRGKPAATYAERLMQDAEAVKGGELPSMPETQRVIDASEKYADQLGYKGKPGGFGQWLGKQSKRDDPIGVAASFLMPFPSMAARMSEAAVKVTPGTALLPGVRKMYPSKFDMIYDQTLGAVAASGVAYWAMNGGITGSGPTDKGERDGMIAQGWQPNSTLVAGHYIPNRVFSRFQPMLDTAGELHDALAYGKKDRSAPEIATDLAKRASKIVTDQTGLSGLADLHDMLAQGFASQFPGFAARSLTRYVPYGGVLRAAAASLDPASRRADKWSADNPLLPAIGEQLKTAVPGLRQSVPAVQDPLGRPAENPQQGLGAFIPRTTTAKSDPVIAQFQRANVDISPPRSRVSYLDTPMDITEQETRAWNEARGAYLIRVVTPQVSNGSLDRLPPARREERLQELLANAADAADRAVLNAMPPADRARRRKEALDAAKLQKAS